jgi:hypothetical protein
MRGFAAAMKIGIGGEEMKRKTPGQPIIDLEIRQRAPFPAARRCIARRKIEFDVTALRCLRIVGQKRHAGKGRLAARQKPGEEQTREDKPARHRTLAAASTRHRELRSLSTLRENPHRNTPFDVPRYGRRDGRSPGSRVLALRRLPSSRQWLVDARLAAYSCAGSHGFGSRDPRRVPIESPKGTITIK